MVQIIWTKYNRLGPIQNERATETLWRRIFLERSIDIKKMTR